MLRKIMDSKSYRIHKLDPSAKYFRLPTEDFMCKHIILDVVLQLNHVPRGLCNVCGEVMLLQLGEATWVCGSWLFSAENTEDVW
jgi:hypothetical protein